MKRHEFEFAAKQFRAGKLSLAEFAQQYESGIAARTTHSAGQPRSHATANGDLSDRSTDSPAEPISSHSSSASVPHWPAFPHSQVAFPRVLDADGKSIKSIRKWVQTAVDQRQPVFITHIEDAAGRLLCEQFPPGIYNATARVFRWGHQERATPVRVVIAVDANGDVSTAEEAEETLKGLGCQVQVLNELPEFSGGAPWQILNFQQELAHSHAVLVVTNGDSGLLPLIASQVSTPVIAIPTQTRGIVDFNSWAAVWNLVNSRIANVAVVGLNQGFRGAFFATLAWQQKSTQPN